MSERQDYLFTSESVGEGHPDKICDQVSDAVLDSALRQDPNAHVACETFTTTGLVLVGGEITTDGYIDLQQGGARRAEVHRLRRPVLRHRLPVLRGHLERIQRQSPDIAQGVNGTGLHHEQGAGDQGMMFGYACTRDPGADARPHPPTPTPSCGGPPQVRKEGTLPFLRPDGKCQVTVAYEDGKPERVSTVVLSHQHSEEVSHKELRGGPDRGRSSGRPSPRSCWPGR